MLNCLLNLLNRWALGLYGLRFPLVMTASHMIFGVAAHTHDTLQADVKHMRRSYLSILYPLDPNRNAAIPNSHTHHPSSLPPHLNIFPAALSDPRCGGAVAVDVAQREVRLAPCDGEPLVNLRDAY